MKRCAHICLLFLILLPPLATADNADAAPPERLPLVLAGTLFDLELALTPKQRERGLMERTYLAPEDGMLFVFPEEKEQRFWMKNTRVDLDIVYLDRHGRIVSFMTMMAEPPRRADETEEQYEERLPLYPSRKPAQFAIEFRAGTLGLLKLRKGQTLALDVEKLVHWAE